MTPTILFRPSLTDQEELEAASNYFNVITSRAQIPLDSLIIGRYSVLPYYAELMADVEYNNSWLINSVSDHRFIADMKNWYLSLKPFTFKTWLSLDAIPKEEPGPFVLKGETNSKKHQWKTHMYAETRKDVDVVHSRLMQDGLIGSQEIYIRKYEPLRSFGTAISGAPITEEYRFFFYKRHLLAGGFYWSEHPEVQEEHGLVPEEVPASFLEAVADIAADFTNFYVVDVARTEKGKWKVVELNDGQMSGLSCVDPNELYKNLYKYLRSGE